MAGAGINREDEPGFNPFAEVDEYREANPAHEPVPIGSLIPVHLLEKPVGSTEPPAVDARCDLCHKTFKARAAWFFGKWRHSAVCSNCGDGITLPLGFLAECEHARTLEMRCPKCGLSRGVDGRCRWNLWEYETDCTHCGQRMVAYRRLRRRCTQCQERFFVDDKRPKRTCHKCSAQNPYENV